MRFETRVVFGLLLAPLLLLCAAVPARADAPDGLYSIRERFGVCLSPGFSGVPSFPGRLSDYPHFGELGFGWYSDWTVKSNPERPGNIEFAQLLNTRRWPPSWQSVEQAVRANPGALWIIGNEPETRGQGQHTPEVYAERYHEAYYFIKGIDPQCQIAIGGVVMPTPLRLKWLDLCLAAHEQAYGERLPVDVWNIHLQILQEQRGGWGCGIPYGLEEDQGRLYEIIDNCNVVAFKQLVEEFCVWLVEHDERDKPLIISEYGVLMPSGYLPQADESVLQFMEGTFDYLLSARDSELGYAADDGRLVQRWMWFSLNFPFYDRTPGGFNGALCNWEHPNELTVFGEFYRDYANAARNGHLVIPVSDDTFVDGYAIDDAFAAAGRLKLRADAAGGHATALLRFDLSGIPQNAVIAQATLILQTVACSNSQPLHVNVGPALILWDPNITQRDLTSAGQVRGEPSSLVIVEQPDQLLQIGVTSIVRSWQSGELNNRGFVIDTVDAGNRGNVTYSLAASEWVEGNQQRPVLVVEYVVR